MQTTLWIKDKPIINLHEWDLVIINSSGGKDSLIALWEVHRLAIEQNYPFSKIIVSHQDLGRMEWAGTKELVQKQADFFGFKAYYSKRRNKDGEEHDLLHYINRRGKFPSSKQRFCTSDFKRAPGNRVVTAVTKEMGDCRVLYVFGFRSQESPARSKKKPFVKNERLTTRKRTVYDWLPIHDWSEKQVWDTIKKHKLPYHFAYDLGMPRLSCCFCIFAPFDALVVAGHANLKLLEEYAAVEEEIGHTFRQDLAIQDVLKAVKDGYKPTKLKNWTM